MELLTSRCLLTTVLITLLLAASTSGKKKKKTKPPLEGVAGKLQDMVTAMKKKGLVDNKEAEHLLSLAEDVHKEFKNYKQNAAKSEEMRGQYETKLKEIEATHREMLALKDDMPEDLGQAMLDLRNCKRRVEELKKDSKDWEGHVNRLVMDLKIADDLHQEDKRNHKEAKNTIAKKEIEIGLLKQEIDSLNERFDALHEHVKYIDELKVDHKAQGVQAAVNMKDERIDFLKQNNRRLQENHNKQVQTFLRQIKDLEAERDKYMRRGPQRQDVIKLQDASKQCQEELQSTKTKLAYKEDVLADVQITKSNLVESVTTCNRKFADCKREARDEKRAMQKEIDELKSAQNHTESCNELREQLESKEKVISDMKEKENDTIALQEKINKQKEIIELLRAYNDPTDCSKVRLKQQQNLDRMAQENMKWANCNVRVKKLLAKIDKMANETEAVTDCVAVRTELNDVTRDRERLQGEVESLEKNLFEARENSQKLAQEKAHVIAASNVKKHKLEIKIEHLEGELHNAAKSNLEKDTQVVLSEDKVKSLNSEVESLQNEQRALETKLGELENAPTENSGDCDKLNAEVSQLKGDIAKKDELIQILRNYNDPTGCMKDRVSMQKNLDRMAQENMKWANCNVRKKKLEAKLENVTSESNGLKNKISDLEKGFAECQTSLEKSGESAATCEKCEKPTSVSELEAQIVKKDELIQILRNYSDPTGCMKDRVSMQKNLDRMAQENMKWANCNVGRKKLTAKLEKCREELEERGEMEHKKEEHKEKEYCESEDTGATKQLINELNMENSRLRQELHRHKQAEKKFNADTEERIKQGIHDASEVVYLQTKLNITEEKVVAQSKIINGQRDNIQKRSGEIKALRKAHEKALKDCCCHLVGGEGEEDAHYVTGSCSEAHQIETENNKHGGEDMKESGDSELAAKLEEMEKERDKFKEQFLRSSGLFTECKMEKYNETTQKLHFQARAQYLKKEVTALKEECKCESVTSCREIEAELEETRDKALNCENTLKFTRERAEKFTTLHGEASKNYTELRTECQGYYDDLQVCTREKNEIEFIKNGLDMVLKQVEDDHTRKMGDLEERSASAVKNEALYRNYFLSCAVILFLLALYDAYKYLLRKFTEHETKTKKEKLSTKESKKKR